MGDNLTLSDLLDEANYDLFSSMCRRHHCLHHLLPPRRVVDNLRVRGQLVILITCLSVVPMSTRNLLWCILCIISYNVL